MHDLLRQKRQHGARFTGCACVASGVGVRVAVAVLVGVRVGVRVGVAVGVTVGVGVGGTGVGQSCAAAATAP
jgi:hypothetical protein